jgi:cation transport regulator ChaC
MEAGGVSSRLAVFGYGSLVSPTSAARTLGREVETVVPARLAGYARCWTLARDNLRSEKTFARPDGSLPRFCLGLSIEPDPAAEPPNGALIAVTETELERLDLREIRYHRIAVTDAVTADPRERDRFAAVFAYRVRPEHHYPDPPEDTVLIANYARTVESAFADLGPGQLELYRRTTRPVGVELTEASLVSDRIPAGNPRDW